jgi:hypothetical protein
LNQIKSVIIPHLKALQSHSICIYVTVRENREEVGTDHEDAEPVPERAGEEQAGA